jgi:GNAT superfamily N-acetyltransferase
MEERNPLPERVRAAGITVQNDFEPGDLGQLIHIHGVQNFKDYGFNEIHEAYCARIAIDFLLEPEKKRSRVWITKKGKSVVGSVLIIDQPRNQAQLRLLFVDDSVRGLGLGRWLVEESVRYARASGFDKVFLWTVTGLDRAIGIYESLGFGQTEKSEAETWGTKGSQLRFDLDLRESRT